MSSRRISLFRTPTLLALLGLWAILILGAFASGAEAGDAGFLRLKSDGNRLSGMLILPTKAVTRAFKPAANDRLGAHSSTYETRVALRLVQELGIVADQKICRNALIYKGSSKGNLEFRLGTDCPPHPTRLDVHFAPFGHDQPTYRTLISFQDDSRVRHAISTVDAACVAFDEDDSANSHDLVTEIAALLDTHRMPARSEITDARVLASGRATPPPPDPERVHSTE